MATEACKEDEDETMPKAAGQIVFWRGDVHSENVGLVRGVGEGDNPVSHVMSIKHDHSAQ